MSIILMIKKNYGWYLAAAVSLALWSLITRISHGLSEVSVIKLMSISPDILDPWLKTLQYGFHYDVNNNSMPTEIFFVLFGLLFLIYGVMISQLSRVRYRIGPLLIIIFTALLMRVVAALGVAIHENDIYRYVWDGQSIVSGINPYRFSPADLFLSDAGITDTYYDDINEVVIPGRIRDARDEEILSRLKTLRDINPLLYSRIGHWQVPTIYPPVAQWLFAASVWFGGASISFMKMIFVLIDVFVILMIMAILKHFHRDPTYVMIYAWSPLVIKEFANSGHYDALPVLGILIAVWALLKRKHMLWGWGLAMSTLSKFFALVLWPIWWRRFKWPAFMIFIISCVGLYLPFFVWDGASPDELFQGLTTYNKFWSYNASVFAVVWHLLDHFYPVWTVTLLPAKFIVGVLYLLLLLWLMWQPKKRDIDVVYHSFLAIAGLFLINPVGDPWYYCWVIPFLCVFPFRSWLLLSGTLILSYWNFQHDLNWLDETFFKLPILRWVIYGPFFIALTWETLKKTSHRKLDSIADQMANDSAMT